MKSWLAWGPMGLCVLSCAIGCSADENDPSRLGGADDSSFDNATGDGSDEGGAGGSGANGGTGGGANGNGSDGSDGNVCSEQAVRNDRVTPDMLIVLDRSSSMTTGVDRWNPSVSALESITAALEDTIRFGLEIFPGGAGGGGTGGVFGGGFGGTCDVGTIVVDVGIGNADEIATALNGTTPSGFTPTAASLKVAHDALNMQQVDPDKPAAPKFVLLVTDGAPNCSSGGFGGGGFGGGFGGGAGGGGDPQAIADTVAEIESMAADGIKTYVIGYDTKNDPTLSSALDMMAAAGDTGDTQHRPVEDEASLQQTFEEIAGKAISCEFVLEEAPSDPSYVLVTIDGEQLNLDDPSGWTISADNRKVTVQGAACDKLGDGGQHVLSVKVLCEVVAPI